MAMFPPALLKLLYLRSKFFLFSAFSPSQILRRLQVTSLPLTIPTKVLSVMNNLSQKNNDALQQAKLPKKYIFLLIFFLISSGYLLTTLVYQNNIHKDIENHEKIYGVLALCIFMIMYLMFYLAIKARIINSIFIKVNLICSFALFIIFIYNFCHLLDLGSLCPFPAGETYNAYLECHRKVMHYYNLAFLNYNLAAIFILSLSAIISAFSKTLRYPNNTSLHFSTIIIFTIIIFFIPPLIEYFTLQ